MALTILIAFISLIGLVVLHEFGHFIIAKRFGVKVEEFGIGYPPRIFGKKIGETIYSLNLLPFGAFVKMPGEIGKTDDPRSFSNQQIWKRALIVFGGVLSFWIIAAILFSIVFNLGTPVVIGDEVDSNLANTQVQITSISVGSPAQIAGLKPGDTIKEVMIGNQKIAINKIKEIQEITNNNLGKEITLTIERGKEIFESKITPRSSPPAGEGPMGVALVRTTIKSYPWYLAPWQGIIATVNMTGAVIQGYGNAIKNITLGKPSGVELMGPVGVFHLFTQVSKLGVSYFLQFVGMIAIYIAIFNILPIPAVDGGKLLFLGIEAARKRPISQKIEEKVTAVFFMALILLMVFVTIKDIAKLF
jgi:regulator of sigma E protease